MKFSVVIPCYNCSSTVTKSVMSVVNQTCQPLEVILINDASSDDNKTINKLQELKTAFPELIKIVDLEENKGPSYARNKGWDLAKGDFVAFIDSDDEWTINKLKITEEFIKSNISNKNLVIGHGYSLDDKILNHKFDNQNISSKKYGFWSFVLKNRFVTPSVVVNRNITERYDETMKYAEDHDLLLRLAHKYDLFYIALPLVKLGRPVLSKGGLSSNLLLMRAGELKMYYKMVISNKLLLPLLPFLISFSIIKLIRKYFLLNFCFFSSYNSDNLRKFENNNELVTIITPVFNCENYIEQCIKSVIEQTYSHTEYIIIDGGSTDKTLEIINKYKHKISKIISEKDKGIYDAMNKGVDVTTGTWLYFIGADDLLADKDVLSDVFNNNIASDIKLIFGNVKSIKKNFKSRMGYRMLLKNYIHHQSAFYHKSIFKDFRYDATTKISGDYELNLKIFFQKLKYLRINRNISVHGIEGVSHKIKRTGYDEEVRIRHLYIKNKLFNCILDILTYTRFYLKKIWSHF